jgi:3-deoxy-D-arabino-heptulosonate 7-phosphate (DAHP) synthase
MCLILEIAVDDDPIEAVVDKEQQLTEKLFEQFHGNLILLRNWRRT